MLMLQNIIGVEAVSVKHSAECKIKANSGTGINNVIIKINVFFTIRKNETMNEQFNFSSERHCVI